MAERTVEAAWSLIERAEFEGYVRARTSRLTDTPVNSDAMQTVSARTCQVDAITPVFELPVGDAAFMLVTGAVACRIVLHRPALLARRETVLVVAVSTFEQLVAEKRVVDDMLAVVDDTASDWGSADELDDLGEAWLRGAPGQRRPVNDALAVAGVACFLRRFSWSDYGVFHCNSRAWSADVTRSKRLFAGYRDKAGFAWTIDVRRQ